MKIIRTIATLLICFTSHSIVSLTQPHTVYVYGHKSAHAQTVIDAFDAFQVEYVLTDQLTKNDDSLYIIFDADLVPADELPHHYIVYQTRDLAQTGLSSHYASKLANAIAVWDYSKANMNHYGNRVYTNLYFPSNYCYADPVILPCFLPTDALTAYKDILYYSNQKNSDISSHLPALFVHCLNKKPSLVLEAGVRGGESTVPLHKACQLSNARLIGVDIEPSFASVYAGHANTTFVGMNDLEFDTYYRNSPFKDQTIDVIFIDTSHQYQHTLAEITLFVPYLKKDGLLLFHDSNVTPLNNWTSYIRLNDTGDSAPGNTRGVTQAIKEYFSLEFNEHAYVNHNFTAHGFEWNITHYPFCNGLTAITKLK